KEVNATPKLSEAANSSPTEKRDLVPINQGRNLQPLPVMEIRGARRRRRRKVALALAIVIGGAGGGTYWWLHLQPQLPPGIAFGNGRIEALEIDIDTKFAGRKIG